jgi:uncharacterized LabA/DUF88 family protein
MERVIAYVDGFNLYFGLRSKGWKRYYWLNIQALAKHLLKQSQTLSLTKYFTARIAWPPGKEERQSTYIEALKTLSEFEIFYGKYQLNPRQCSQCGFEDEVPNEKMTDVNIAVEILKDAYQNKFDVALITSADSDLVPPVKAVRELFPEKRVVVASPPGRYSVSLANSANSSLVIGRGKIAKSVFPQEIKKADGYILQRPVSWE